MRTLVVYKDEYSESQMKYLMERFYFISETEKAVTIQGEEKELENVMMACYSSDEQFKKLFPEYLTEEERKETTSKLYDDCKRDIQDYLLKMINEGATDEKFKKLREMWMEL
jgi:hypothetical protein